jgi:hypothetical protein
LADLFTLRLAANPFSAMRTVTVPEVAFNRAAAVLAAVGLLGKFNYGVAMSALPPKADTLRCARGHRP